MNSSADYFAKLTLTFHLFNAFLTLLVYICLKLCRKNRNQCIQPNLKGTILFIAAVSVFEASFSLCSAAQLSVRWLSVLKTASLFCFTMGCTQWFLYVFSESSSNTRKNTFLQIPVCLPAIATLALSLFAGPRYFVIDETNQLMEKGDLFLFWYFVTAFYLLGASAIALIFSKSKSSGERRQMNLAALFPAPAIFLFLVDKFFGFQFKETGICFSLIIYFIFLFMMKNKAELEKMQALTAEVQEEHKKLAVANVQAESANYAKSAFLFNMSHDVRTPLNAITGYTAMALKYIDDKSRVCECVRKIQSSGEQLLKLMNRVLDMSRIESGDVCINEEPLDIVGLYKNAVAANMEAAQFRSIQLLFTADNIDRNKVYADEVNINQIVSNIVGNAIKYTEPNGTVKCTLQQIPSTKDGCGTYRFITEDTGIGMSKEFVSHIFEVFSREKTSTLSGKAGVGLGMSVVKRIVDKMGGKISVSSELGKGTCVTVTLNFRTIEKDVKVRTFDPDAQDLNGRRVLIVEDNEMNREIAKDILEDNDMIVEEADDGTVAVEKVIEMTEQNGPFYYDFILMDIQMPNMNGYDAAKAIRSISALHVTHLPIIAMTANAFEDDRRKSFESGMDAHLAKPIDVDELLMTLKIFLR